MSEDETEFLRDMISDDRCEAFVAALSARSGTAKPLYLRANALDDRKQVVHDEVVREAEDVTPDASQRAIPASIGALTCCVIAAIDLDDQLDLGSVQIRDEPPRERHLPPKRDPEPPAAQSLEELRFRGGGSVTHLSSALFEHLDSLPRVTHESLRARGEWPGRSPTRRRIRDVRSRCPAPRWEHGTERALQGKARPLAEGTVARVARAKRRCSRTEPGTLGARASCVFPCRAQARLCGPSTAWGRPQRAGA